MENHYRHKKTNLKSIIVVAIISFCIPIGLHFILKNNYTIKQEKPIEQLNQTNQTEVLLEKLLTAIDNMQRQNITNNSPIESNAVVSYVSSIKTNNNIPPSVEWLASPVTQTWKWDGMRRVWTTTEKYEDSMRANPSIEIGLREDGIVVWRKINKN